MHNKVHGQNYAFCCKLQPITRQLFRRWIFTWAPCTRLLHPSTVAQTPSLKQPSLAVRVRLPIVLQRCKFCCSCNRGIITRPPPPRPALPGSITVGWGVINSSMGHVVASPLGRPYPMGTVSTSVVLLISSVLPGDHWLAARRPRPLPAPLLGGNQGRLPLWVSSSSVSYMTSKWPLLTCKTDNVFTYLFLFLYYYRPAASCLTAYVLLYLFIYFLFRRVYLLSVYLLNWYLWFLLIFILFYYFILLFYSLSLHCFNLIWWGELVG